MKKLLAILLASVMTLSLCACGLDSPSADSIRGEQIDDGTPEFEAPIDSIEIPSEVSGAVEITEEELATQLLAVLFTGMAAAMEN